MGETEKTSKAPKENWFAGLKAEFGKIIWPAITCQTDDSSRYCVSSCRFDHCGAGFLHSAWR